MATRGRVLAGAILSGLGVVSGLGVAMAAWGSASRDADTPPSPISIAAFCGSDQAQLRSSEFFGDTTFESPQEAAAAAISTAGANVAADDVAKSSVVNETSNGLVVVVPASVAVGTDVAKYGDFHVLVHEVESGTFVADQLLQCQ